MDQSLENRSQTKVDHVLPEGAWKFDEGVTDAFDNMLKRSIPQYDVMRKSVFDVGCRFVKHKTTILDLGCSRGEALAPFVEQFGAYCTYVGVEVSEPMLEAARKRFSGLISSGLVEIKNLDLRTNFPPVKCSLVISVLTMMFVPMEHRQKVIREIYKSLVPGGALIMVEKILGATAEIDALFTGNYYDMKRDFGYSEMEIERKRLSLEGVLVPVTARWNEELLRMAGFNVIDCFWRWMNFAGWLAIRE